MTIDVDNLSASKLDLENRNTELERRAEELQDQVWEYYNQEEATETDEADKRPALEDGVEDVPSPIKLLGSKVGPGRPEANQHSR